MPISALADSLGSVADLQTVKPIVEQALDQTVGIRKLLTAWAARLSSDGTLLPKNAAIVLEVGHRNPDLFAQLAPSIIDHYGERRLIDARRTWLDRLEVAGVDPNLLALWRCISQRDEDLPQRSERIAAAALGGQMGEELRRRWEQELGWSRMALGTMRSVDDIGPVVAERLAGGWDVLNDDDAVHYGLMATRIGMEGKDPAGARVALERARNKVKDATTTCRGAKASGSRCGDPGPRGSDGSGGGRPSDPRRRSGLGDILTEPLASWRMKDMCLREALKSDDDQLAALYFEVGNTLQRPGAVRRSPPRLSSCRRFWSGPERAENFWVYGPYSKHNIADSFDQEFAFDKASIAWDQAIDAYEYLEEADDPYLCWAHAAVLLRRDRVVEAARVCLRGLRLWPTGLDLLQLLIEIRNRDLETAARRDVEMVEFRRTGPTVDPPRRLLTDEVTQELRWRAREASTFLRRVLTERADASCKPAHHRECATLLLTLNDVAAARRYIDKAIELDPDDPLNKALLGQWHEVRSEWAAALDTYDAAAKLAPDKLQYQSSAGFMLARLKRFDEAEARATPGS